MDFTAAAFMPPGGGYADDSSNHSATETCTLPAYLRAPEVTSQVMAEYIWLMGGTGQLRSKTKVLETKPNCPEEAPVMVVESNPGNELAEPNHELFLKPRKIFRDPFRGGDHILVLCDTFYACQPSESNSRVACENVLKVAEQEKPVFAAEQEYAIIHPAYPTVVPLGPRRSSSRSSSTSSSRHNKNLSGSTARGGVSKSGHANKASSSMAANPARRAHTDVHRPAVVEQSAASRQKTARLVADSHLRCCLYAGIKVTGADVHSLEGLHSYKIGPSAGVDLGDDLWTSRYLLQRVAEDNGASVSWDPDALPQERPLGCYFKFSTAATRHAPSGLGAIEQQLARLQATHIQHQFAYNDGKLDRLAALHVSSFTHAVGTASASIVVPSLTYMQQGGYYIDRRPPADADPYKVTLLLAATTLDIPLPKLPASSSAAASMGQVPSAIPDKAPVPRGLAFSPMDSYLLALRQQQHCMHDSESEECDSIDEDACMTEDSAALLAKMDKDGDCAEASSCESDYEQDDASSSPHAEWDDELSNMQGEGI
ncbi:hypothetical protein VOLCADRAFT_104729 [Volvox carteri f. nagariensis]|uniref:glutamine synthetase n=1 Tax=Volvox carteri f. nagariensis TaxID=3068 RepID=D8TVC2_VOLCA|nr:uncharacterized protein VOLCADRAFT_104729 [Volvox carteri f. nagariensis]EFJ48553.1 hypothetical protein VOLCADRAFT_104729 [Volvox carteri f. nagariensis]|eukprot:XP_002950352.1 hypothetical protein VOLCADRAFT_104729 [Volvox carteri f. nagariensis]